MFKIAVLVSGGGTNLQAIINAIEGGDLPDVSIVTVVSNNAGAFALERAKRHGLDAVCISPKQFPDREAYTDAMIGHLKAAEADLIVLAGFLVVSPPRMVKAFENRIINIHPSLIPSFCGTGCYGLKVHEQVLERGVKVTGATVHFVDCGTDTGPILLQAAVAVHEDDTPKSLQQRVMQHAEWRLLPEAVRLISQGLVEISDGRVHIRQPEDESGFFRNR